MCERERERERFVHLPLLQVLMDDGYSEDISEVCKHSDVDTLIEALEKKHPEHTNIKNIGKLRNDTCARDKYHPMR